MINIRYVKGSLERAKYSLQDLEHIKHSENFTQNFTAANISIWIKAQQYEIQQLENLLNNGQKEQIQ